MISPIKNRCVVINRILAPLGTALLVVALVAGCRLTQPSPGKHQFWLDPQRTDNQQHQSHNRTLQVRQFRVAAPFDQKDFVYRLDAEKLQADFYNEFLSPPAIILTELTRRWLDQSRLFGTVLSPGSQMNPDYLLEAQATELAGDFRDLQHPQASLAIQFWLLEHRTNQLAIAFHQDYSAQVPLSGATPEQLAHGWSKALEQILNRLEKDLQTCLP